MSDNHANDYGADDERHNELARITDEEKQKWLIAALQVQNYASRIAKSSGSEKTKLKQLQRPLIDMLADEVLHKHGLSWFTWDNGVHLVFDPDNKLGSGNTHQDRNDQRIDVRVWRELGTTMWTPRAK